MASAGGKASRGARRADARAGQPLARGPAARVAVVGASGFAGALAARLVWFHPALELRATTARSDVGSRLDALYPRHRVPMVLEPYVPEISRDIDAAIVAYPHGAAAPVVAELREAGVLVVDLSADFRIRDVATYEQTYCDHGAPDLLPEAVYGLPEEHREEVRQAKLVAAPGCYPTATLLALMPLAERGLVGDVYVDAKSGVSGAGRAATATTHFCAVTENVTPYAVRGHRHLPEIVQELEGMNGRADVTFVPHLVPIDQGLLTSCCVRTRERISERELLDLYEECYSDEPFVSVVAAPPGVRDVRDTNFASVHATLDSRTGRVVAFAAIDNLWKGAAGQGVQCLNLMLGLPETEGLLQ